jgi:hypothetical protein
MNTDSVSRPWYRVLYLQVLLAVALGIFVGAVFPEFGKSLRPLGDAFIKLVKMMMAPRHSSTSRSCPRLRSSSASPWSTCSSPAWV